MRHPAQDKGYPSHHLRTSGYGYHSREPFGFNSIAYATDASTPHLSPLTQRPHTSIHDLPGHRHSHRHNHPTTYSLIKEEQQEAIALVYRRRKTLETFFDAWKWIVTWQTRSRRAHLQVENTFKQHAPRPAAKVLRYQDIDQKEEDDEGNDTYETFDSRRKSSPNRYSQPSPFAWNDENSHDPTNRLEFVKHIRRKYEPTRLKITDTSGRSKPFHCNTDATLGVDVSNSKHNDVQQRKRRFRDNIRVIYQAFRSWKEWTTHSLEGRARRLEEAMKTASRRLSRKCFDAWHQYTATKHQHAQDMLDAWRFHDHKLLHKGICFLKHRWLVAKEMTRLQRHRHRRRLQTVMVCWRDHVRKSSRLASIYKDARRHRHRRVLRRYWKMLRVYVLQRRTKTVLKCKGQTFFEWGARRLVVVTWKRNVFQSRLFLASTRGRTRVSLSRALRKWRQLVCTRRRQHHFHELCVCFVHFRTQRTAWRRWRQFRALHRLKQQQYQQADGIRDRVLKKRFIKALDNFTQRRFQRRHKHLMAHRWCSRTLTRHALRRWKKVVTCATHKLRLVALSRCSLLKQQFSLWYQVYQRRVQWRLQYSSLVLLQCRHALAKAVRDWQQTIKLSKLTRRSLELTRQTWRQSCFHLWRRYAKQRQRRQEILDRVMCQQALQTTRRSFRQWKGVLLRKKCMAKLVHLFRKKTRRWLRQQTLQQWHRQVKIALFERRHFLQRFVREVLLFWRLAACSRRRWREQKLWADTFATTRKQVMGVSSWIRFHYEHHAHQQALVKAQSFWYDTTMQKMLTAWRVCTQKRLIMAANFADCLQRHNYRVLTRAWGLWHLWAGGRATDRRQKQLASAFCRETEFFKCWLRWLRFLDLAALKQRRHQKADQLFVARKWRQWRHFVVKKKRLRAKSTNHQVTRQQCQLDQAIHQWKDFATGRIQSRKNAIAAYRFRQEQMVGRCLVRWFAITKKRRSCVRKQKQLVCWRTQQRLGNAVGLWHAQAQRNHQLACSMAQFQKAKRLRRTRWVWSTWRRVVKRHRARAQAFHDALGHSQRQLCRRLFRKWREFKTKMQDLKHKLHQLLEREDLTLYRITFGSWRRYVAKQLKIRRVIKRWQFSRFVEPCWLHWRVFHELQVTSRHAEKRLAQLHQELGQRKCLETLKALLGTRIHCEWALNRARELKLTAALMRWLQQTQASKQQKLGLLQMQQWHQARSLTRVIRKWTQEKCLAVQKQHQKQRADSFHRLRLKHKMLVQWNQQAHAQWQWREQRSEQFRGRRLLVQSWHKWHDWLSWNYRFHHLQSHRARLLMVGCWRQWAGDFVARARQKHLQNQQAQALCGAHRLQRSWSSWRRFLARASHRAAQRAIASAFYTCELLQRRFLVAWWQCTLERRQVHANAAKACGWHHRLLLEQAFGGWLAWLAHLQVKKERHLVNTSRLMAFRQAKALARWHQSTKRKLHLSICTRKALRFHQKRREHLTLWHWTRHLELAKQFRARCESARQFWMHHVVQKLFDQWKRFWLWRRSHQTLVTLFNANCRSVCFAKWRLCHARKQHRKQQLAKAREWNKMQGQRSACKRWRLFVAHQCQKRQAWQFFVSHVQRRMLCMWRKQCRILKSMKLLWHSRSDGLLKRLFDHWKQVVRVAKARDAQIQQIWRRKQVHNLRKWFTKWQNAIQEVKKRSHCHAVAQQFRNINALYKLLCLWRKFAWIERHKRKKHQQAVQMARQSGLRRHWNGLLAWVLAKSALRKKLVAVQLRMQRFRVFRTVQRLQTLCQRRQQWTIYMTKAMDFEVHRHLRGGWHLWRKWLKTRMVQNQITTKAVNHAQSRLVSQTFDAWKRYQHRLHELRERLRHSRCRFVFSIAARCFYQWSQFVNCKRRLHALVQNRQANVTRSHLIAWQQWLVGKQQRYVSYKAFVAQRHHLVLRRSFAHWESVTTDLWITRTLVESFASVHLVKRLRWWFVWWRGHGQTRHLRKKWRRRARRINGKWLQHQLKEWHWIAVNTKQTRLAAEVVESKQQQRVMHEAFTKWKHTARWWRARVHGF